MKRDWATTFTKLVALYLVVLISLRLGLEWILGQLNATDHMAGLTFRSWASMAFVLTVAILGVHALAGWTLKPSYIEDAADADAEWMEDRA